MATNPDQHQPDIEALIEQGIERGLSEAKLRASAAGLKPIFDSLSYGEQPAYERLDRVALAKLQPEIAFVVRSMAQSPAADLRTAGFHVMGVLDSESFIPDLQAGIGSAQEWERVEAIRALGRMSHPAVQPILLSATKHPEHHTRQAATTTLAHFEASHR